MFFPVSYTELVENVLTVMIRFLLTVFPSGPFLLIFFTLYDGLYELKSTRETYLLLLNVKIMNI